MENLNHRLDMNIPGSLENVHAVCFGPFAKWVTSQSSMRGRNGSLGGKRCQIID